MQNNILPGALVIVTNSQGCWYGYVQGMTSSGGYWVTNLQNEGEVYVPAGNVQAA